MVLQLKDGNYIAPKSVFDVLDVVEEYIGTDVRQYLEDSFDMEPAELNEEEQLDALREHYMEVLQTVEDELDKLSGQKQTERKETLERVKNIIRRETR